MKKTTLLLSVIFMLLIGPLNTQAQEIAEADKITTTVNVTEKGKMQVTQELEMFFNEPRRGIFVSIPQKYEDMVINGVKYDFFMPVDNLQVLSGDPVNIESDSNGVVMQIGDPDVYHEGAKTYVYQYDVQMYPWTQTDTDIFYMDLISDRWEFPVHKSEFMVTFPEDVSNEVYFYATQENRPVDFSVDGNVVTGSYNETLFRQGITMETTLGDNYFDYPESDYSIFVLGAQGIFTGLLVLLYFKFGKDYHVVDSVEFTAPDGLSSADVGYIYKGIVSSDDVISLIIYWASKGYLMIEELENDEMELTKVKEMDTSYPAEERRIFNALFAKGEIANTKTLSNKFGVTLNNAKQAIPQSFSSSPERRIFEMSGITFKYVFAALLPFFSAGLYASFMYAKIPSADYAIPYAIIGLVTTGLFMVAGMYLFDQAKDKRNVILKFLYLLVFVLVHAFIALIIFYNHSMLTKIKFGIQALVVLISILMLANMSRRTEQGTRWYGQILGLKRFIETAEKGRLEMLAEQTPTIFYDILPFAFVLGVTDVWSKKFRDIHIDQPDWYQTQGNVNFTSLYLWSSLNRSINTMRPAMTSVPAPVAKSGGGGNFGGGGGFGGGGSSGGGFGGAGGGSW